MALASTYTATVEGVVAHPVKVEANIGKGLPGMFIVGLAGTAVKESRDRIRTAVMNARLPWPKTKITVSLSPANLPKAGSHFDLPVAIAVLSTFLPELAPRLSRTLLAGELGLDGRLRGVDGVLPMLAAKTDVDFKVIPTDNADEAALLGDRSILVADTLQEVWQWLQGGGELLAAVDVAGPRPAPPQREDFQDIAGQSSAKHALEVAAAGGHHVFMTGPPGSGKSMLAARLPSILPPLSTTQMVEATAVHSVAAESASQVITHAPYVAPHPAITKAALIGGGSGRPMPGAVSLAHHGVLFLDEVSEIPAVVLDGLRVPLEEGAVRLSRAQREVTFPARFQLILAANPCRCGAADWRRCTCSSRHRATYLNNVSVPLRDRIDIAVETAADTAVLHAANAESSAMIAERVALARERSTARWQRAGLEGIINATVSGALLRREYPATESGMALLSALLSQGDVTQRGVDKSIKLAWTLADLAGADQPELEHVAQAVDLRDAPGGQVAA
ncbi:YifB family Mg chelatase-like AAA ATPase [Corynebacterium pilosum]|uniref:Predicted ATPase with chaperone activity n=1 Tax=Corynebacterium pilosum TaxID=35756 RepID=A0A376CI90_9CORY|nr:YifB family Mg chelatase-like AAA ATPase [Corynebacterium pilosum]STC68154.1 predicted ATPase with chaperone activity [Corynebacterium pilosum]